MNESEDRQLSLEEWMSIPSEQLRERSGELRSAMVIPANHIRCVGIRVMPKSWWVRLLEFLHLRRKVWDSPWSSHAEVSHEFVLYPKGEVTPDTKSGT